MRHGIFGFAIASLFGGVAGTASAAPVAIDATPAALSHAMQGHRVVLLGEVHDNAVQHALRAESLRQLLVTGVRPALAFEQFDRERQRDIDRARRERPADADYLIAQAKSEPGWDWRFYRPYVALALEYNLPIVAANLSRDGAMRAATGGFRAVLDEATIGALRLDTLPADLRRKQERAIAAGHCDLLHPDVLAPHARAQIARDVVIAQSIAPYAERGVVLLAGDGHVRRDVGVPVWLPAQVARNSISIGLLERSDAAATPESADEFDAYVITEAAKRDDPCAEFERRGRPAQGR